MGIANMEAKPTLGLEALTIDYPSLERMLYAHYPIWFKKD